MDVFSPIFGFYIMCISGTVSLVLMTLTWLHQQRKVKTAFPNNMVILHQVGRGPWAPSVSPFPLKLETFLRMAKIPYKNVHGHQMSSKGKTPWITFNGQEIADSQFCIDFLSSHFNIDLYGDLPENERAVARAFQKLTEENLYWTMCAVAFGDDLSGVSKIMPYSGLTLWIVLRLMRRKIHQEMWGHGIGRHDMKDILRIGYDDLRALSTFLGKKRFFMGEEPCEVDCAIFGMVAEIRWHMADSPHESYLKNEFTNLASYCDRMKEKFWPDWDDCITHGGTVAATK